MRTLILTAYNLLLPVFLLLSLPGFLLKGKRRGGLRQNFGQRFGRYDATTRAQLAGDDRPIWIHAVSVGEVLIALKILNRMQKSAPDQRLVLSTTTTTGYRLASDDAPEGVTVIYNPVDLPWVVARAIRLVRPCCFVLVEAEVWPNVVNRMRREGVPVLLVNARLSDRSERRFRAFRGITRPIFGLLSGAGVCFEDDIERIASLGIEPEKITFTGNVKFDVVEKEMSDEKLDPLRFVLGEAGIDSHQPILLAGSTHPGEEALVAKAFLRLREKHPELGFVAVPRHVERSDQVVSDLESLGLTVRRRSVLGAAMGMGEGAGADQSKDRDEASPPVALVVDTTGELRAWYHLASVVVIGKTFLAKGGQNPVEPILAGCPVVAGPHMGNFRSVVKDLDQHRGILRVEDLDDMVVALQGLLDHPEQGRAVAAAGRKALESHLGATQRTVDLILARRDGSA